MAVLVAVGDALVRVPVNPHPLDDRPWLTPDELAERVARFRGRGRVAAVRAAGRVRPGVESRPETLVRLAIVDAGLPEPEVNLTIAGSRGELLGRADRVYRRWRVIVEYDADQHRTDTRQFDRNARRLVGRACEATIEHGRGVLEAIRRRRSRIVQETPEGFAAHGWTVVRITGRAFFGDWATSIARVEQALIAAGWRRG